MNKYELIYIIDVALEEAERKALIERISTLITGNGGEVEKIDEWGKRRLAYSIDYKNEGYYVLVNFSAGSDLPREIERVLQISENVLRYLIVKIEQKRSSVKPRPVPVRPVYARPPFPGNAPDAQDAAEEAAPVAEAEAVVATEAVVETEAAAEADAVVEAETVVEATPVAETAPEA